MITLFTFLAFFLFGDISLPQEEVETASTELIIQIVNAQYMTTFVL